MTESTLAAWREAACRVPFLLLHALRLVPFQQYFRLLPSQSPSSSFHGAMYGAPGPKKATRELKRRTDMLQISHPKSCVNCVPQHHKQQSAPNFPRLTSLSSILSGALRRNSSLAGSVVPRFIVAVLAEGVSLLRTLLWLVSTPKLGGLTRMLLPEQMSKLSPKSASSAKDSHCSILKIISALRSTSGRGDGVWVNYK